MHAESTGSASALSWAPIVSLGDSLFNSVNRIGRLGDCHSYGENRPRVPEATIVDLIQSRRDVVKVRHHRVHAPRRGRVLSGAQESASTFAPRLPGLIARPLVGIPSLVSDPSAFAGDLASL